MRWFSKIFGFLFGWLNPKKWFSDSSSSSAVTATVTAEKQIAREQIQKKDLILQKHEHELFQTMINSLTVLIDKISEINSNWSRLGVLKQTTQALQRIDRFDDAKRKRKFTIVALRKWARIERSIIRDFIKNQNSSDSNKKLFEEHTDIIMQGFRKVIKEEGNDAALQKILKKYK